jgi:tripartite-type tricarboxylate transporter receptor subunit TctC
MKDYELLNWFALFATAGTPAPVVARLNQIANAALRDPAVAQKLEVQGIVPRPLSPAEFRSFVDAEVKKFGEIMTRANIHAEN